MTELQTPAAEHQSTTKRARAAWWTLGVLTFVSILDWADRALISVVAEPLRHEFELSDTELGFSMAFAFGIVRVFIGIPVGRLADTHNRRNILASALAIWSVMTVAFGLARTYTLDPGTRHHWRRYDRCLPTDRVNDLGPVPSQETRFCDGHIQYRLGDWVFPGHGRRCDDCRGVWLENGHDCLRLVRHGPGRIVVLNPQGAPA